MTAEWSDLKLTPAPCTKSQDVCSHLQSFSKNAGSHCEFNMHSAGDRQAVCNLEVTLKCQIRWDASNPLERLCSKVQTMEFGEQKSVESTVQ